MREGNAKLTQAILRQLYEENAALIQRVATLLYETMRRIIFEAKLPAETFLEIEEPQYAGSLTQVFRMAERAALCICEQTLRKKEAASVGINQSLVEYVDENVFDPELSLNMLSDIFGVSNASISRLFKNATGDTLPTGACAEHRSFCAFAVIPPKGWRLKWDMTTNIPLSARLSGNTA